MSWASTLYRFLSSKHSLLQFLQPNPVEVIDPKSHKLNIVLNIHSPFCISYIAKFVRKWHKMCSSFTEKNANVYFLRQKEESIEEGNVAEVEEEWGKNLDFFLKKG